MLTRRTVSSLLSRRSKFNNQLVTSAKSMDDSPGLGIADSPSKRHLGYWTRAFVIPAWTLTRKGGSS